jgi:hypothetical protein
MTEMVVITGFDCSVNDAVMSISGGSEYVMLSRDQSLDPVMVISSFLINC